MQGKQMTIHWYFPLRKAEGNCKRLSIRKTGTRPSCSYACRWYLCICMAWFASRKRAKRETSAGASCWILLKSSSHHESCCLKAVFTHRKRIEGVFLKSTCWEICSHFAVAWDGVPGHQVCHRDLHFMVVSKQGMRRVPPAFRLKIIWKELKEQG